jgi:hypothetical protein
MKCVRLIVALGACSLLLASAASAEPAVHTKAAAASIAQKSHVVAKPDRKAARNHGHKRPVGHDATLDWPQLG